MYYGIPIAYSGYPNANTNNLQHPFNLNHPDGLPRNERDRPNTKPSQNNGHTHALYGATTCQKSHTHLHPMVSSTPIETNDGHVHVLSGNTTFEDEHIHSYEAYTGTPIRLENGYHTHYVEIKTTFRDGHSHTIKGFTTPSKS